MIDTILKRVLLLGDSQTVSDWSQGLAGDGLLIWHGQEEMPVDERPDVLVTNNMAFDIDHDYDGGVVFVGDPTRCLRSSDVRLPHDCSLRELAMACRLLAENTHLRRRARAADEMQQVLSIAATTDPLTNLANRRAWDAAVTERRDAALAGQTFHCLAIVDLDRFKEVNDTAGHLAGDRVLKEAADALTANLRNDDFVARLGGDEFGLLLVVSNEQNAAVALERVRLSLSQRLISTLERHVTASIGFAIYKPNSKSWTEEEWFHAADEALVEAKNGGRDRVMRHE